MAEMWSEDYVWKEIGRLAQEVAEQTAIIQELKEWEEAADRYEAAREETLVLLSRDIERCRREKLQELKREWGGKRSAPDGIFAWNQHARHTRERYTHPVEVGQ